MENWWVYRVHEAKANPWFSGWFVVAARMARFVNPGVHGGFETFLDPDFLDPKARTFSH